MARGLLLEVCVCVCVCEGERERERERERDLSLEVPPPDGARSPVGGALICVCVHVRGCS
jgi:hypothetical protein